MSAAIPALPTEIHPLAGVLAGVTPQCCPTRVNFHCHTVCSDGSLSPAALAQQALSLGLEHLAITDHHSLAAYDEAHAVLEQARDEHQSTPRLWRGVEISALLEGCLVHVLALGFEAHHPSLQAYLQGASGDYNAIAKDTAAVVAAAEEAGRKPAEDDLLRLADAYLRTGNNAGNIATLEKLVTYYPKKDYVNAYLGRLQRKPGFSERFTLDVMRLKLNQGLVTKADDYFEMAQLALQADQPAEAKMIMDRGYAAKVLGVGAEADRHKRLMELADKKIAEGGKSLMGGLDEAQSAKDGNQLAKIGIGLIGLNKLDTGIALLEKAIAMGGLKRPDDAKLRLGLAQIKSGNKAKGGQTLKGVGGKDGAAKIARLWMQIGGAG